MIWRSLRLEAKYSPINKCVSGCQNSHLFLVEYLGLAQQLELLRLAMVLRYRSLDVAGQRVAGQ